MKQVGFQNVNKGALGLQQGSDSFTNLQTYKLTNKN